jgi:hypothetical protein
MPNRSRETQRVWDTVTGSMPCFVVWLQGTGWKISPVNSGFTSSTKEQSLPTYTSQILMRHTQAVTGSPEACQLFAKSGTTILSASKKGKNFHYVAVHILTRKPGTVILIPV